MNITRPPLRSLACINPDCELYSQTGNDNLVVRKIYGANQIRCLRCRCCTTEFSERKGSALSNVKLVGFIRGFGEEGGAIAQRANASSE